MHLALAELVAAVKPFDVPHFVTVTSSHDDVDDPGLNDVPATHFSQPEFADDVPATNPSPVGQFASLCAAQTNVDDPLEYVPGAHALQVESAIFVPATKPWPLGHSLFV